jgi:hypothetical protein
MATSLSILISDTSGCVIFRRTLSIAPVSGQPWEDFQLNHLVLAFLVAARFADRSFHSNRINSPETPKGRTFILRRIIRKVRTKTGFR